MNLAMKTLASVVAMSLLLSALPAQAYYGLHSQEAELKFDGEADLALKEGVTLEELNSKGESGNSAQAQIEFQLQHLMGAMHSEYFKKGLDFKFKGIIGTHKPIVFKTIGPGKGRGRKHVTYNYDGIAIFEKDLFHGDGGRPHQVPILLPLQADKIYKISNRSGGNYCMEKGEPDPNYFWYYWDLARVWGDSVKHACPLKEDFENGGVTVIKKVGTAKGLANTEKTCPQYGKLYGKDTVKISLFYGYVAWLHKHGKPNYTDENYKNMQKFEEKVLEKEWGFAQDKTASDDNSRSGDSSKKGNTRYHVWKKKVTYQGREIQLIVYILLADTDLKSTDKTFHQFIKPALEDSDLLAYDGHAGTGANLSLNSALLGFPILKKNKYQVFFFNGCYTYPYFNKMYFDAKG